MATNKLFRYQPDYATSPGEVLESYLSARSMTKAELATRCGRPTKTISEIIHGKAAITPETALQLERVLGVSASIWQNLEGTYRLKLAERSEDESLEEHADWARRFPVKLMVERGCIDAPLDVGDLVKKLLRFFGVGTVNGWHASFGELSVAYRKSPAFTAAPENMTAWLRLGEIEGAARECAAFDPKAFKAVLTRCRALTSRSFPEIEEELQTLCASAGVALVFVPELPKTHVSGVARWLNKDKALIQLSLRYRTADSLWFTFFHEAGHILLHGKKTVFIDESDGAVNELEKEADRFASDLLIPPAAFSQFKRARDFSTASVKRFAEMHCIAPGIVVGRLHHEKVIPFSYHQGLKERLTWADA